MNLTFSTQCIYVFLLWLNYVSAIGRRDENLNGLVLSHWRRNFKEAQSNLWYLTPILSLLSSLPVKLDPDAISFKTPNVSRECANELNAIKTTINQTNIYQSRIILSMLDASGKLPPGVLRGNTKLVGLYSECEAINDVELNKQVIRGGYGRISIDMTLLDYTDPNSNCQNPSAQFSSGIFVDVCLPRHCSGSKDLTEIGRAVTINGKRPVCGAYSIIEQGRRKNYQTWIVVAVLAAVGVVGFCGTTFDYFACPSLKARYAKKKWMQCMLAFSLYTNICQICDMTNVNKPGQIGPIHFMRLISMCWVIIGHVCMMTIMTSGNTLDTIRGFKDVSTGFLTNSFFAVDTFFFMSGLLLGFVWFKGYYKNPRRQMSKKAWIMFYVHRFLRLSPPYYLVIAFYTFVFNTFLINMPNLLIGFNDSCESNWWINFLYLTNYIDYKNQCYLISWYLATDIQMYIFAPVILIPLAIKPLYGYITSAAIFLASTAGNMATVYRYYFPPTDFSLGTHDPRMKDFGLYTLMIYDAPWIRCQVYIIGILTGYLLQTKKKLRIPFILNLLLWLLSLAVGLTVILVLRDWVNGALLSMTENAFYSAFSRIGWGLALAYIIIACYYGYGGPINQFMSWSIWAPFGRLTYCGYLLHIMIVFYMLGMGDSQIIYTNFSHSFVTMTLPGIFFTFTFALFWSALFEIPTAKVEAILLGNLRSSENAKQVPESDNSAPVTVAKIEILSAVSSPPKVAEEEHVASGKESSDEKL